MIVLHVAWATLVLLLTTSWGMPTVGPVVVGALCGLVLARKGPRVAATSAILSWGGLLAFGVVRGQPIGEVAGKLGSIMGVPGTALLLLTVLYPAVLSTTAAYLAAQVSPMRTPARTGT